MNKKLQLLSVIIDTEDELLIRKLNAYVHGYYSKKPNNLDIELRNNKESEVNIYNVKEKLIKNIILIPEKDYNDLQYLHRLYKIIRSHLIKNAAIIGGIYNE